MKDLKTALNRKAQELGFSLFGVTPADPLDGAAFYARWIAMGFAGEMDYLKRNIDKRGDLTKIVPGARSVICLGMEYLQPSPEDFSTTEGRFASYARGDDYHELIKERLFEFWDFIRSKVKDVSGRVYVDTAPVLERELAQRAGIGWIGKNTCIINKHRGSYFFLSEIVSTLELPSDEPATDHCGNCTKCIDACPTNAFPRPYVMDASRCISYLTIEHKSSIPEDLRPKMGNWIFGCDICQDVCPWNKRASFSQEPDYESREGFDKPPLIEWMQLDKEQFNQKFRGNPAKRPKRRGLLRNVAIALGNSGDQLSIPALILALRDEEPLIRSHAAWGLGQLGGDSAHKALLEQREHENDISVMEEIDSALKNFTNMNHFPKTSLNE
jgi:epoxyqueuosine reductase